MSAGKHSGHPPDGDDADPDPFDRWFPDKQSQPERDPLIGRVVGGVWIERCIGQGGMGRVYKGLSRDRGEAVAVKVIQPGLASTEHLEALRREARILGLFDHPNIAPVYAAGTEVIDGMEVPYLVMKLIRGARSIVDFVVGERLSTRQRVKLFRKVCAAVGHGHGRSIIHRDLKPSNILVDDSGNPFIIDFGVARSLNPELTRLAVRDRTGEIPGTYLYMSPEQFKGDPDAVDKRTDVYSLGVILYELLTGRLPQDITKKPVGEIARIVQYEPPVPIGLRRPDLKPAVRQIVGKCLEKRPTDRYPDASGLLAAVIGTRPSEPVLASMQRRVGKVARGIVRHRSLLAGMVLGACLALLGERALWVVFDRPAGPGETTGTMARAASDPPPAKPPVESEASTAEAAKAADSGKEHPPAEADPAAVPAVAVPVNAGGSHAATAPAPAVPVAPTPLDTVIEEVETEDQAAAVDQALKWLVEHQLDDGSWSYKLDDCPKCAGKCSHSGISDDRVGATALALLPFLGRGYTHKEGPYKKQIERGIAFLAAKSVVNRGKVYDGQGTMHSQGLACTALAECYELTQDKRLAQPAQLALNFIMASQDQQSGGWRREPGQPADIATTCWQIEALRSGYVAYLQVNPLSVKKVLGFLDSLQIDGGFRHHADEQRTGDDRVSNSFAVLCRMYLGWKQDNPSLQQGVRYLAEIGPTKDIAYDFYATNVMHHIQGEAWQKWNEAMKPMIRESQSKTGHESGSWYEGFEESAEAKVGGRLYCTAMATLMLEVYYRRLPIYRNTDVDEEFKE